MKRIVFFLLSIIGIAVILRFYQLGSVPVSPDWDETALGYNAYSILKTGRDEYGNFLPLTIRSFDDYKPPLYVYLTVPSVALFGLSVWSTRLPSALMGVLAVVGVYFLAKELFGFGFQVGGLKTKVNETGNTLTRNPQTIQPIALLSALLLALSPWHVVLHLSPISV
jgi:4-amino-4-deoxy-L-arabinose transferase-like glycosyltransferase